MCGINVYLNKYNNNHTNALAHRGPDTYNSYVDDNVTMEFNRLKINDLTENGNQPLIIDDCILVCNGEIFNHEALIETYNFQTVSRSDCEVIIHLYIHLKSQHENIYQIIHNLCNELDGEFAFCLFDKSQNFMIYARDVYGVRPLFYDTVSFGFASEMKAFKDHKTVCQFPPGHFAMLYNFEYMSFLFPYSVLGNSTFIYDNEEVILENINKLFRDAVKKRMMSDREICALLSGGLDSSLVCALLAKYMKEPLKTFSIGFAGSPDLHYAKLTADFIGSEHTSIELSSKDFLNAITEVIKVTETYDTTTIRASVGNYLVAKYISDNTDSVVIFNGDYSDEVCGGYKYFHNCHDPMVFHNECIRLVNDICYFDSLRSDRSISANGLEARVPFADKHFVEYYTKIHPVMRMSNKRIEKYLLRKAFEKDHILPPEILWRKKEAFSDGVSKETESWSEIVNKFVDTQISDDEFLSNNHKKFKLKETYFYHKIFKQFYNNDDIIPYLWMPKFCDENIADPSARKLSES